MSSSITIVHVVTTAAGLLTALAGLFAALRLLVQTVRRVDDQERYIQAIYLQVNGRAAADAARIAVLEAEVATLRQRPHVRTDTGAGDNATTDAT